VAGDHRVTDHAAEAGALLIVSDDVDLTSMPPCVARPCFVGVSSRPRPGRETLVVRMDRARARELFAAARVARLATADADGAPHLVPIVFALDGDTIYSAVDDKPKRSRALRRLANVAANSAVAVLVDHYDEDWTALWWVRADGTGRVLDTAGTARSREAARALTLLTERYPQYRAAPPPGPVLAVDVARWSGWAAGACS
jgi:PPOX class probable F420-dependent enzyme